MDTKTRKQIGTSAVGAHRNLSIAEMRDDFDTQLQLFQQHNLSKDMMHTHYVLVKKDGTHQLMKRAHAIDWDFNERGNKCVIAAMEHTLGERLFSADAQKRGKFNDEHKLILSDPCSVEVKEVQSNT